MRLRLCIGEAVANLRGDLVRLLPLLAFLTLGLTAVGVVEGTTVNNGLLLEEQLLARGSSTWVIRFSSQGGAVVPPSAVCEPPAGTPGVVTAGGLATFGSRRLAASPATRFRRVVITPGILPFFGMQRDEPGSTLLTAPSVAEELRISDHTVLEFLDGRGGMESDAVRISPSISTRYPAFERALFEVGWVASPEALVCLIEFQPWVDQGVAQSTAALLDHPERDGTVERLLLVDDLTRDPRQELRTRASRWLTPVMVSVFALGVGIALLARRREWVVYRLCRFSHLETTTVVAVETWLLTISSAAWALWLCSVVLTSLGARHAAIMSGLWLTAATATATLAMLTLLAFIVPPRNLLQSLKED